MTSSTRLLAQLGHPSGLLGRLVLNRLNVVNQGMNQMTLEALDNESSEKVLEIGFGGGGLVRGLLDSGLCTRITGLEVSELAITRASKIFKQDISRDAVLLKHYDGNKLPFRKGQFTAVCSVNVIYFVSDIAVLLKNIHRVLVPGGRVVLTYASESPDGVGKFPAKDVEKAMKKISFAQIQTTSGHDTENGDFYCTVAIK